MPTIARIVSRPVSPTTPSKISKRAKRSQSVYQLAADAVIAAAKDNGLTCHGWLKSHPSDPCRKTRLTDTPGAFIGYGYCTPSGVWWLARGKYAHGQVIADGKIEEPTPTPVTPPHTVLCCAAVANRHEKALVVSGVVSGVAA